MHPLAEGKGFSCHLSIKDRRVVWFRGLTDSLKQGVCSYGTVINFFGSNKMF